MKFNAWRLLFCKKSNPKTENPDEASVDTVSSSPQISPTQNKRSSNLRNGAPLPIRLSLKDFFITDDERFICVKKIVPVTSTDPVRPIREAKLPIYDAETQTPSATGPIRSSSLSRDPGHEILYTLEQLSANHRRVKSSSAQPQKRPVTAGVSNLPDTEEPARAPSKIARGLAIFPELETSVISQRPLSPLPKQKTPPSPSSSSDTSNRSSAKHSASSSITTASTSLLTTEHNAERSPDDTSIESSIVIGERAAIVATSAEDGDIDREPSMYETQASETETEGQEQSEPKLSTRTKLLPPSSLSTSKRIRQMRVSSLRVTFSSACGKTLDEGRAKEPRAPLLQYEVAEEYKQKRAQAHLYGRCRQLRSVDHMLATEVRSADTRTNTISDIRVPQ